MILCSLGGFTALATAASLPDKVVGVVLLNSAGQFGDPNAKPDETQVEANILEKFIIKPLKDIFQRVFLGFLFWQAKQPARIESVLKSVSSYSLKRKATAYTQDLTLKLNVKKHS